MLLPYQKCTLSVALVLLCWLFPDFSALLFSPSESSLKTKIGKKKKENINKLYTITELIQQMLIDKFWLQGHDKSVLMDLLRIIIIYGLNCINLWFKRQNITLNFFGDLEDLLSNHESYQKNIKEMLVGIFNLLGRSHIMFPPNAVLI